MARTAREKSKTGIYHVMLRGNNKQTIFLDKKDYLKFLEVLKECKEKDGFKLYAYCLMPNHIHLLIQETEQSLGQVMRRIGSRFVTWYNIRHGRIGHLFQDRFKSEPINDDPYFCTVLRYIHMNPVKAGLCADPEDYPFCSYPLYFEQNTLIDSDFFIERFGTEGFRQFHQEECDDICMDIAGDITTRLSDQELTDLFIRISNCKNIQEFHSLPRQAQQKSIHDVHQQGASMRKISIITGLSLRTIQHFCK